MRVYVDTNVYLEFLWVIVIMSLVAFSYWSVGEVDFAKIRWCRVRPGKIHWQQGRSRGIRERDSWDWWVDRCDHLWPLWFDWGRDWNRVR